jgi:hypothetical protein
LHGAGLKPVFKSTNGLVNNFMRKEADERMGEKN